MTQATDELGRRPLKKRSKEPDDALPYSVKHWIKVEALAVLHEGEFGASEVAERIGQDVKNVRNHIYELYEAGCVEVAEYRKVGNYRKPIYRAIELPVVTDEVAQQMSAEERHDVAGAITQGILTETVSSYRSGKLDVDPVCLMWDAMNLDAQGEQDMHELLVATWNEALQINAESTNRMAESSETGTTTFVGLLGFERGRPGRPEGGYLKTEKPER